MLYRLFLFSNADFLIMQQAVYNKGVYCVFIICAVTCFGHCCCQHSC